MSAACVAPPGWSPSCPCAAAGEELAVPAGEEIAAPASLDFALLSLAAAGSSAAGSSWLLSIFSCPFFAPLSSSFFAALSSSCFASLFCAALILFNSLCVRGSSRGSSCEPVLATCFCVEVALALLVLRGGMRMKWISPRDHNAPPLEVCHLACCPEPKRPVEKGPWLPHKNTPGCPVP